MLVVAGRVHRKSSTVALDFLPNNSDGHVLRAPIALQCAGSGFSNAFARLPRSPDRMQVLTAPMHMLSSSIERTNVLPFLIRPIPWDGHDVGPTRIWPAHNQM